MLCGCSATKWVEVPLAPTPLEEGDLTSRMRVEAVNGESFELSDPSLGQDTLRAVLAVSMSSSALARAEVAAAPLGADLVCPARGCPFRLAVSDLSRLEKPVTDWTSIGASLFVTGLLAIWISTWEFGFWPSTY